MWNFNALKEERKSLIQMGIKAVQKGITISRKPKRRFSVG